MFGIDITIILAFCSAVTSLYAVLKIFREEKKRIDEPKEVQNGRIADLERRLESLERRLVTGDDHFDRLDKGIVVTQKALVALLQHAISGDNTDQLNAAREALNNYLIEKQVGGHEPPFLLSLTKI